MKKLFLILLFSGSLDSFSQVPDTSQPLRQFDASKWGAHVIRTNEVKDIDGYIIGRVGRVDTAVIKPDTIRAIVLVTLFPNGIAHSRMGFVVIQDGRKPVYLTCDKKPLKLPQVGWGYELVEPNRGRR